MPLIRRIFLFALLITPVLFIQTIKINRPIEGHFSSYQMVMASMSRNMLHENFTELLKPKTELVVNGKKALHLNQYPFPSLLVAAVIKIAGGTFEFWGRFQAVVCNLLSILLIGLIARKIWGEIHAWISMVIYAFSPYTLIYGQGFFSEPMAQLFLLMSLYLLIKRESGRGTILSAFCFSLAITSRIHWVLLLPVSSYWILFQQKENRFVRFIGFSFIALVMPAIWYFYTYWMGLRIDYLLTNAFLQAGMRTWGDHQYLLDPDYYRRLFDIFSGNMLTPLLLPFFFLGILFQKSTKGLFLLVGIAVGSLIIILCPQKIMAHDFYLYAIFPFICWLSACGVAHVFEAFPQFNKKILYFSFIFLYLAISSRYFYHPVFKQDANQSRILAAASAVKNISRSDEMLIVAAAEPAPLVYYADRPALTIEFGSVGKAVAPYLKNPRFTQVNLNDIQVLESAMKDPIAWFECLRQKGAHYFVSPDKELLIKSGLLEYLENYYQQISKPSDPFFLFSLGRQ